MKQSTAEKEGSISIWGDKRGKREKITKNSTTKSSHPHFRHLQISKTEINVVIVFLAKIRRVYSSVLCKVEEVRTRNYNLEQWRAKIPLRVHTRAHECVYIRAPSNRNVVFLLSQVSHCRFTDALWWRKSTFTHPKNDPSFFIKQAVVFKKWPVIFRKTSRRDDDDGEAFQSEVNDFHGFLFA